MTGEYLIFSSKRSFFVGKSLSKALHTVVKELRCRSYELDDSYCDYTPILRGLSFSTNSIVCTLLFYFI